MSQQRYFEDVASGDDLPPTTVEVTPAQLFFFSAATYNGHLIHYNHAWATAVEGHRDVVIHGPLQVALAVRMVTDWIGARGRLVSYSAQSRGSAYLGETLQLSASVDRVHEGTSSDVGLVDLTMRVMNSNAELLVPGTATVALPIRQTPRRSPNGSGQ